MRANFGILGRGSICAAVGCCAWREIETKNEATDDFLTLAVYDRLVVEV